jgi:hypothetical protein
LCTSSATPSINLQITSAYYVQKREMTDMAKQLDVHTLMIFVLSALGKLKVFNF